MSAVGIFPVIPAAGTPHWSSSDPVHCCLRDVERTEALLAAIAQTVRPGDIVVDAGAGSGILSLAAAKAGAACVLAVELDPHLVECLRTTIAVNGFAGRIEVVAGNALTVDVPRPADVVIAELIDTGLLDELQVPVLNAFHERGVIGPRTRVIPTRYVTSLDLVAVDDTFYGFRIAAPIHDWRTFLMPGSGWYPWRLRPLTSRMEVAAVDFHDPVEPWVERDLVLTATGDGLANGIRLTGVASLAPGLDLGATNALNGNKILLLPQPVPLRAGERLACRVSYQMGGGLGTFVWRRE
ncbi:MAG: hypothetical protein QOF73_4758 [Thermomicrobiales bacterium]|nr:hypothetical protein [Thermomicrobiales bacterium]